MIREMLAVLALLPCLSVAQSDTPPAVSLRLAANSAISGQTLTGTVTVEFASGLHGYQNPPAQDYQIPLSLKGGSGVTLVKADYPKGQPMRMAGETKDSMVYAGAISIPVVLKVTGSGKMAVDITVAYQQCTESACYPPSSVNAEAFVVVGQRSPVTKPSVRVGPPVGAKAKISHHPAKAKNHSRARLHRRPKAKVRHPKNKARDPKSAGAPSKAL